MESGKYNKLVNIPKRNRLTDIGNKVVVTSEEREGGRGNIRIGEEGVETVMYKIKKLRGCIVQHKEYTQYFIITINGI